MPAPVTPTTMEPMAADRSRARRWGLLAVALCAVGCDHGAAPPLAAAPRRPAAAADVGSPRVVLFTSADVDARLRAEWQRAGVAPTPPADDATWLRRAWLDVLGTIPPPEVVLRFLADTSTDKRARAVDDLLASPLWADHWTDYWDDVLMGRDVRGPDVDRGAFRSWLHGAFAANLPWNDLVTRLITASGRSSEGGPKRDSEINDGRGPAPEGVNGAVNFTLKYQQTPQDMAGAVARTLLGVQIQCAQCHDHKTEKWTQKDFQSFAAAFARTRPVPLDPGPAMGAVRRVDLRELDRAAPRFAKMGDLQPILEAHPTALDGTPLGDGGSVRDALARWMTRPQSPWFSRAIVNRMWGHFLGRGFVDPVDDFRTSNPATAPAVLDALAADFTASGYDLKHLVRVIVGCEAYARSAAPLDAATLAADPEAKLWERFRVLPLGPGELLSALVAATRLDAIVRATGRMDLAQVRYRVKQRYGFLFDVDEASDDPDYDGTMAQALALLNGSVVATGASVLPGSALAEAVAMPGDDRATVEALYVRTLTRLPSHAESERWIRFLEDAQSLPEVPTPGSAPVAPRRTRPGKGPKARQPDPLVGLEGRVGAERSSARVRAFEDLLWVLLNSSEFGLNH